MNSVLRWQDSPLAEFLSPYVRFVLPLVVCVAVVRLSRSIPLAAVAAFGAAVAFTVIYSEWSVFYFSMLNGGPSYGDAWTILICNVTIATTITALITARRWLPRRPGEPLVPRRFRQFSLATMFSVVTVAACGLAVGRYFIAGIMQFLPLILVLAIMVNPFRVIGDWARGRARLQAVRARLRRHAEQAGTRPGG